ncbi:MAG: hypothetical protein ACO294_12040 [Methylococcales bacterium]
MRKFIYIALAIMSIATFSPTSLAKGHKNKIDATIHLTLGSVAAGVGWTWGEGVLTYQGVDHKFEIKGLSVADVGISKLSASGVVHHMNALDEFNGSYYGVKGGVTIAGGVGALALKNNHGVVLELNSTSQGLKFELGAQGVTIQLKD